MHIHGHIHNHDHSHDHCGRTRMVERETDEFQVFDKCKELDKSCADIFCNELDDCYFGACENPKTCDTINCFPKDCVNERCVINNNLSQDYCNPYICESEICADKIAEVECCEDPACLRDAQSICNDPRCLDDHEVFEHENNLCSTQQKRMSIFRNLLGNVQRTVELLKENISDVEPSGPIKRRKLREIENDGIQIHFPHPCHLSLQNDGQDKLLTPLQNGRRQISDSPTNTLEIVADHSESTNPHKVHQSCFHARVPSLKSELQSPDITSSERNDFDFFLQFNNFNSLFGDDSQKEEQQTPYNGSVIPPQSPNAPSSYSCKWENCCKKVDDNTLLEHLIDDHINEEYDLDNRGALQKQAFQCEWYNCGFTNENYASFVSHLSTHKGHKEVGNGVTIPKGEVPGQRNSPLLTPNSLVSSFNSPRSVVKKEELTPPDGVSITLMEIKPKKALCCQPIDPLFTCKWQVGIDSNSKPIICGKVHSSDGELQAHLQQDHIGLGKHQYQCCWLGCERNGGKPFLQRQKLYRHIHIHTNYKPCKCEFCGASFAVAATLKQHMRIHSGEKPFSCKHCDKKFTTSSALAIHTRVHSGEKPLKCHYPGCGKSFSESSNLAKHKRVHQKRFTCDECGEVFDQKKLYTKHKRAHTQQSNSAI